MLQFTAARLGARADFARDKFPFRFSDDAMPTVLYIFLNEEN